MTEFMEKIISFLNEFWGGNLENLTLSAKDFFDILIVAFLIYFIIYFFIQTRSIFLVFGVLFFVAIYALALILDLSFTTFIFNSFAGIFLLILLIVFQKEVRNFFYLIGFMGVKRRFLPVAEDNLGIIVKSVGRLMREKIGAIIVFPGREPIERFLEGGYLLDGEISEPLILSIFDDTSPGHDGAVVIRNNKIWKFGVHLPLAEHIEKVKKFGLRHRAALGLSEHSDAFVTVISEEKGTLSIAEKGHFYQVKDEFEWRDKLIDFLNRKFPQKRYLKLSQWFRKNFLYFVFSFLLSLGLFIFINPQFAIVQRNFVVPIEFKNLPPNLVVSKVSPSEATLVLQARKSDFDNLNISDLRIVVNTKSPNDISGIGWHSILTNSKNIEVPVKLNVVKIEPSNIRFLISEKDEVLK